MKHFFHQPRQTLLRTGMLVVTLAASVRSDAADSLDWFTLDAGGGIQSSASYVINFTAGQNDVGAAASTSASYRVVTGFWALENMGPDNGLPTLRIARKEENVVVSWPSPSTGFFLQQADSLDVIPANWVNTPGVVSDTGFEKNISIPANAARRFYRLRRN